jgi:hypothetical protein
MHPQPERCCRNAMAIVGRWRAHPVLNPEDMVDHWLDRLVRERQSDLRRYAYPQMKGGGLFELPG